MRRAVPLGVAIAAALSPGWTPLEAQVPLGLRTADGQSVTPVYEGWYHNPDGTYSLSFGYYNRNFEEVLDVAMGEDNYIEPGQFDGVQPTRFHERRHWGVFTVTVPPDFGDQKVTWTVKNRGGTFSIPGSLHRDWQIDALEGEAGAGNTPPRIKLAADGREAAGPGGLVEKAAPTKVGVKTPLTAWVRDDGKVGGLFAFMGMAARPLALAWFKHSGPGDVTFSESENEVPWEGGSATTQAIFSEPGDYVIRVRVTDSDIETAGHAQCCWTNGFLKVTVTH